MIYRQTFTHSYILYRSQGRGGDGEEEAGREGRRIGRRGRERRKAGRKLAR